jgi:RNA-binding protein
MTISAAEKKYLRRLGHNLKPVVTVATKGLSENVLSEINRALEDHELIKIKLAVGDRATKGVVADQICRDCDTQVVQSIGHILLLYRKALRPNPRLSNILR